MAEPITPTAATLVASGVVAPVLVVAGVSLGLRVDVLIAGFAGAIAAIVLLDTVPRTNDSTRELIRSAGKRVGVALASATLAGYLSPIAAALFQGLLSAAVTPAAMAALIPAIERGCAFILGGGAQRFFRAIIDRGARRVEES